MREILTDILYWMATIAMCSLMAFGGHVMWRLGNELDRELKKGNKKEKAQ